MAAGNRVQVVVEVEGTERSVQRIDRLKSKLGDLEKQQRKFQFTGGQNFDRQFQELNLLETKQKILRSEIRSEQKLTFLRRSGLDQQRQEVNLASKFGQVLSTRVLRAAAAAAFTVGAVGSFRLLASAAVDAAEATEGFADRMDDLGEAAERARIKIGQQFRPELELAVGAAEGFVLAAEKFPEATARVTRLTGAAVLAGAGFAAFGPKGAVVGAVVGGIDVIIGEIGLFIEKAGELARFAGLVEGDMFNRNALGPAGEQVRTQTEEMSEELDRETKERLRREGIVDKAAAAREAAATAKSNREIERAEKAEARTRDQIERQLAAGRIAGEDDPARKIGLRFEEEVKRLQAIAEEAPNLAELVNQKIEQAADAALNATQRLTEQAAEKTAAFYQDLELQAGTALDRIEATRAENLKKIDEGVKSGSKTEEEAAHARVNANKIADKEITEIRGREEDKRLRIAERAARDRQRIEQQIVALEREAALSGLDAFGRIALQRKQDIEDILDDITLSVEDQQRKIAAVTKIAAGRVRDEQERIFDQQQRRLDRAARDWGLFWDRVSRGAKSTGDFLDNLFNEITNNFRRSIIEMAAALVTGGGAAGLNQRGGGRRGGGGGGLLGSVFGGVFGGGGAPGGSIGGLGGTPPFVSNFAGGGGGTNIRFEQLPFPQQGRIGGPGGPGRRGGLGGARGGVLGLPGAIPRGVPAGGGLLGALGGLAGGNPGLGLGLLLGLEGGRRGSVGGAVAGAAGGVLGGTALFGAVAGVAGGIGALSGIGVALAGFLSNPVGLAILGGVTAAAAITAIVSRGRKKKKASGIANDGFGQIDDVIDRFKVRTVSFDSAIAQMDRVWAGMVRAWQGIGGAVGRNSISSQSVFFEGRVREVDRIQEERVRRLEAIAALPLPGFATGGLVPGGGAGGVQAIVHPGEFVVRREIVERVGIQALDSLNSGRGGGGDSFTIIMQTPSRMRCGRCWRATARSSSGM